MSCPRPWKLTTKRARNERVDHEEWWSNFTSQWRTLCTDCLFDRLIQKRNSGPTIKDCALMIGNQWEGSADQIEPIYLSTVIQWISRSSLVVDHDIRYVIIIEISHGRWTRTDTLEFVAIITCTHLYVSELGNVLFHSCSNVFPSKAKSVEL